jgi:predicted  nucleic acid-binding Zn-ribbon protein
MKREFSKVDKSDDAIKEDTPPKKARASAPASMLKLVLLEEAVNAEKQRLDVQEKNEELQETVKQLTSQVAVLKQYEAKANDLEIKNQKLETERKDLKVQVTKFKTEINQLNGKVKSTNTNHDLITKELETTRSELTNLKGQFNQKVKELQQCYSTIADLKQTVNSTDQKRKSLSREKSVLEETHASKESEIRNQEQKISFLHKTIAIGIAVFIVLNSIFVFIMLNRQDTHVLSYGNSNPFAVHKTNTIYQVRIDKPSQIHQIKLLTKSKIAGFDYYTQGSSKYQADRVSNIQGTAEKGYRYQYITHLYVKDPSNLIVKLVQGHLANGFEITIQGIQDNSTNFQTIHAPNTNFPIQIKKGNVLVLRVNTGSALGKTKLNNNIQVDLSCDTSQTMHLIASDQVIPSQKTYSHIHKGGWIFNGKSRSLILPKAPKPTVWLVGVVPFDSDAKCQISVIDT